MAGHVTYQSHSVRQRLSRRTQWPPSLWFLCGLAFITAGTDQLQISEHCVVASRRRMKWPCDDWTVVDNAVGDWSSDCQIKSDDGLPEV